MLRLWFYFTNSKKFAVVAAINFKKLKEKGGLYGFAEVISKKN